jgi:hypothetical protein
VRVLKSINFSYVAGEDRILAAINPGDPEAWSCWLTRRLVSALLQRAAEFLADTSSLMEQAPADVRGEILTFEREAAMATTVKAMSKTPADVLKASATAAKLVERLTISSRTDGFRLELRGEKESGVTGWLTRAELQRVLLMLQVEVTKGGWFGTPAKPSTFTVTEETGSQPIRH